MKNKTFVICPEEQCTGCRACINVCKSSAINMQENKKGFLYPFVDSSLCIDCKKCIDRCPANNPIDCGLSSVMATYAAWNKDKHVRFESSSGGVFTLCAENIIAQNGVVFGARWTDDFKVIVDYADSVDGIKEFRGSKYQQADTSDSFARAKEFLDDGRVVLFSGTPCIIHGLKQFLHKSYQNLITIDVVCHGVPSPKIFQDYRCYIESQHGSKFSSINLRSKIPEWGDSSTRIGFENGENYQVSNHEDPFFVGFAEKNIFLRDCCSVCTYTHTNRVADITLADFWHYYPKKLSMTSYENGCSAVLVNSMVGERLFQQLKDKLIYQKRLLEEVIRGNLCLKKSFPRGEDHDQFWVEYEKGICFEDLAQKYFRGKKRRKTTMWGKVKNKYKFLIPSIIVKSLKTISG